jgi:hypothetical protein
MSIFVLYYVASCFVFSSSKLVDVIMVNINLKFLMTSFIDVVIKLMRSRLVKLAIFYYLV